MDTKQNNKRHKPPPSSECTGFPNEPYQIKIFSWHVFSWSIFSSDTPPWALSDFSITSSDPQIQEPHWTLKTKDTNPYISCRLEFEKGREKSARHIHWHLNSVDDSMEARATPLALWPTQFKHFGYDLSVSHTSGSLTCMCFIWKCSKLCLHKKK